MVSTSSANLTCLCGEIIAPGSILSGPVIPISFEMCHCDTCRYTHGSLGTSFAPLSSSPASDVLSKLTAYHSSPKATRYFCSTCGCHCFHHNKRIKQWFCLGGIIELDSCFNENPKSRPKDTVQISGHDFVLDTIDGGLAPIMLNLGGRSISASQDSIDLSHETVLSLPSSRSTLPQPTEDSYLPTKCHCGGVSLLIKRANYTSPTKFEANARGLPSDPTKYITYMCACRSCRLSTGISLVPWTLIPLRNVFNGNNPAIISNRSSPPSKNTLMPVIFGHPASRPEANQGLALKHHWSSPDVCRSFCGNCGATVFYWSGQRPDEVDLAVGVLRAEDGSMARKWLEWEWGRCSFMEECIDGEVGAAWLSSKKVMENIAG
jgi:hypothetical protein